MSKFRKKPVVIDAFKFTGEPEGLVDTEWFDDAIMNGDVWFGDQDGKPAFFIKTLEGVMRADLGDYIIKGVKGEIYPCKADIFELTYEAV